MYRVYACKDKQGHLVEWVEKSYFTCLNKLFEIDQAERSHFVLLKEKNLKVVLKHLNSFMIPVFSQLRPSILVPDEHFVLKNLSF